MLKMSFVFLGHRTMDGIPTQQKRGRGELGKLAGQDICLVSEYGGESPFFCRTF